MSRPSSRRPSLALLGALLLLPWAPLVAQDEIYDDAARAEIVETLATLVRDKYVFPAEGAQMADALRGQLAEGRFDAGSDAWTLAPMLHASLDEIAHDKHLRVRPAPKIVAPPDADVRAAREAQELEAMRKGNFGFEQVLRLDDNVGYLDLRGFAPLELAETTAVGAMNLLAHCDALVVDLRHNGGGDPRTVQLLCSYLFDEKTHLNSLYWREGDQTEEFWTLDEVRGPRLGDVPVFVLTSARTASGAEEFSYNLQTRGRARIVGETTAGGAHPGDLFELGHGIEAFIALGRAVNPVTGTNWEGVGVVPDVSKPSSEALDHVLPEARKAARERAAKVAARDLEERLAQARADDT